MNNRHIIDDRDIVHSEQVLDQGIPLPFLSGKYEVKEGFKAVILVGGTFEEILSPGFYYLSRYTMFRNVRAILVDMRVKQMHIKTSREFQIDKPVSVQIDLDMSVEYKVTDPQMVAIEIESPLSSFFDRILEAIRPVISNANIEQVRKNGEGIAQTILQRLKALQLEKLIGIEVRNVVVTTIKALDSGEDALSQQNFDTFTRIQEWRLESGLLSQTKMTPEWLIVNRPEIYQQMMAGNTQVIRDLIDKGLLDPANFLNQAAGNQGYDMGGLLNSLTSNLNPNNLNRNSKAQQISGSSSTDPAQNIHSRIKEDVEFLKKLSGASVEVQPGKDEDKIPDGSYHLQVKTPSNSGGQLVCYFYCSSKYPNDAPLVEIEKNGETFPFESSILRHWNGQYLVELVQEAITFTG